MSERAWKVVAGLVALGGLIGVQVILGYVLAWLLGKSFSP